jgi:hypothetical protein
MDNFFQMSIQDWVVILAGAAAIAWVNWYFFLARRKEGTWRP